MSERVMGLDAFYDEGEQKITLATVYEHLADDESKKIYKSRSLYSLTNDVSCMDEMIRESVVGKYLLDVVRSVENTKKIILFGAGTWGKSILKHFPDINIDFIVDNNKKGQELKGIRVISPEELKDIKHKYVIVSILFEYHSVRDQLLKMGMESKDILLLGAFVNRNQYFDLQELSNVHGGVSL